VPTTEATIEQIGEWMSGLWPQGSSGSTKSGEVAHA
jgi:hypothetical protein